MKHFIFMTAAFIFFFMAGADCTGDNLDIATSKIKAGIHHVLKETGEMISHTAKEAGKP